MDKIDMKERFDQVRMGDKEAFADIYHFMKTPVYTVIYRIVCTRESTEDIMQDLFLKLYTSPPTSSVKNIRSWIFRMAYNLALDALRKKSHSELQSDYPSFSLPIEEEVGLRCDLERALYQLSAEEREIVTLHLSAELSFQEIARIMGMSLPAVYRRYKKALKILRKILKGEEL